MQNKPTDKDTMLDTMSADEIDKVLKDSMSQLISATGAMLTVQRRNKGIDGDPTPFEVLGWLSANLTQPVFSCYAVVPTPICPTPDSTS